MEDKFLQYLDKLKHTLDEKKPNTAEMSREELVELIESGYLTKKNQLKEIIGLILYVVQELYFESYSKEENLVEFEILEGEIVLDISTGKYSFTPSPLLEKLFVNSERTNTTKIKSTLETRFYKMLEALYRVEIN